MVHIVAISGSLRSKSYNTGLLRAIANLLPSEHTIDIIIPGDLPLFNQELEGDATPQVVLDYRDRLRRADAFLFAANEYNFSVSAALKNAIDWGSRGAGGNLFNDKPGAVVSAAGGAGGLRAQNHLRDIALFINLHMMNHPQVQVKIRDQPPPFDDSTGDLISVDQLEHVGKFLQAFLVWAHRIGAK